MSKETFTPTQFFAEIDRLRSENAGLREALLELMFAEKLDDDNPRLMEARKQARAILERTKK